VLKIKVVPKVSFILRIRRKMLSPVAESRLAVGSSASTIAGFITRARAIATR